MAAVFIEIATQMGWVPNVFRAMAVAGPDVLAQNWTAYRETVLTGHLSRALKEMVGLVVAQAAGCGYSIALHRRMLERLGVAPEVVIALVRTGDSPHLPLRERALLRFAEGYNGDADDPSLLSLEGFGFTAEEMDELTDTVLLTNSLSRFACESGLSDTDP